MSDLPTKRLADDFSCCQTYKEQINWVIAAVIVRHNRERVERLELRERKERIQLERYRNWKSKEWKRRQGKTHVAEFSYLIEEEIRMMMEDMDERQVSLFNSDEESVPELNNHFLSDEESVLGPKYLFLSDDDDT